METSLENLGRLGGDLMAPLTWLISRVRHARMFHPDGIVFRARVEAVDGVAMDLQRLGRRLAGPAVVRFSSAWWRGEKEWPDVLGMAIRFVDRVPDDGAVLHRGDQDLLLATIRFPWTTPLSPLATRVSSYLWNHFHAVSPFDVDDVGRVKLRMRSPRDDNAEELPRAEHLAERAASGSAVFELQVRRLSLPVFQRRWESAARLVVEAVIEIDQARLHFSPFHDGRGIHPHGFVHHLRVGTYASSQDARPASDVSRSTGRRALPSRAIRTPST